MPTTDERLATLEAKVDSQHATLIEVKLLLEGLQPYQVQAAVVHEWQAGVAATLTGIKSGHVQLKERVTALEMWRSFLFGGMSVIMFMGGAGLITALVDYLGKP
mgnify:CR=1 FL=1